MWKLIQNKHADTNEIYLKSNKYGGMTGTYWNFSFKKLCTELFVENKKCLQTIDLDNTLYIVMAQPT